MTFSSYTNSNASPSSRPRSSPTFLFGATLSTLLLIVSTLIPTLTAFGIYQLKENLPSATPVLLNPSFCHNGSQAGDECWLTIDARITNGPTVAYILAGGLGVLVAIAGVIVWRRSDTEGVYDERSQCHHSTLLLTTYTLLFATTLATALYTSLHESSHPLRLPPPSTASIRTLRGPYTREGWTCGLAALAPALSAASSDLDFGWAASSCTQMRVVCWSVVVACALACVLLGVCACGVWSAVRARRERARRERWGVVEVVG